METIYTESRHSTCNGCHEPIYDKFIVEDGKPIKYYWRLGDSEWKINETSGNADVDKSLYYILASPEPALLENGWISRVMSPLEALVVFGKE